MKSFQEIYTEVQDISGEDSSAWLTRFKRWVNDTEQSAITESKMRILETTSDITTVASTSQYSLPQDLDVLLGAIILNGTTVHAQPEILENAEFYNSLLKQNAGASNITEYIYPQGQDFFTWPTFSAVSWTIRLRYRKNVVDMSLADYTTGTISAATNASATVTGSSTAWTGRKPVRNQWIKLTPDADGDGDARWYKVNAIGSDTSITLESPYLGSTFTGQSLSYILAEFPNTPEGFQNMLVYRPLALYYDHVENTTLSGRYWRLYDGGYEAGLSKKMGGLMKKFLNKVQNVNDGIYTPPLGTRQTPSQELRSASNITGESW